MDYICGYFDLERAPRGLKFGPGVCYVGHNEEGQNPVKSETYDITELWRD
jgi:hypothetical protein